MARHEMIGIVLAGGLGTRLSPLTDITNKHLLPVYDKPMVFYPIETLVGAGIRDILLVTGGNSAGDFLRLLGNGRDFGLEHLDYVYQEGEGGIAAALSLARYYAKGKRMVVILGDNIIEDDITPHVEAYRVQEAGAKILLKEVADPERFGVAELEGDRVLAIEEKPKRPKTSYAVTGIYMYDDRVFSIIDGLEPSQRGELEITDVNNDYIVSSKLTFDFLKGWWTDAGTFESLLRANLLVARKKGAPAECWRGVLGD
jgi:glucose-1-phosphate thymidylyltransferase